MRALTIFGAVLVAVLYLAGVRIALAAAPLYAPDPGLTPGVADPAVTQANIDLTICIHGYTARVRNVPESEKLSVFREYGVDPRSDHFEVDHLISLELGGANDVRNLWPQSYTTQPWNAHLKDHLENRLHALVCAHKVPLVDAQHAISTDWESAFKKYVNGDAP